MSWDCEQIPLEDERYFETLNGLWKGKEEPFTEVGVIRNTNFTESGRIDYSDIAWLPVEEKKFRDRRLVLGDVIIERSGGGPNRPVGRVVYFDRKDGQYSFSNFTSAIRVKDVDAFDHKFVFYGLMNLYQSGQTEDLQRQTTNIRNLDFTGFKERAKFPLLKLLEQHRIARVLSTVQEAIAQQERLIRTTTELKQALMQKLFTEGLRGEALKETEIGRVPESWEVVKLEEFCQRPDGLIQTGPFGSQLHSHEYTSEGIPVVNPTHLSGNRINHEDVPRVPKEVADRLGRHYVQLGDILFARRGEIGRHGLVGKAEVGWLCGTGCFLVRANDPRLNNEYLSYFCSIKPVVDWLNSHAAGAIMPNLSTSVIANLPVGLPPLDEQRQIIEAFNALEQKLDQAEQKRTKLQDLFRTLLHELMTGKVRVNID